MVGKTMRTPAPDTLNVPEYLKDPAIPWQSDTTFWQGVDNKPDSNLSKCLKLRFYRKGATKGKGSRVPHGVRL